MVLNAGSEAIRTGGLMSSERPELALIDQTQRCLAAGRLLQEHALLFGCIDVLRLRNNQRSQLTKTQTEGQTPDQSLQERQ